MKPIGPVNCARCGKFVGRNGDYNITFDWYNGCVDYGYPLCAKCLEKTEVKSGDEAVPGVEDRAHAAEIGRTHDTVRK